MTQDISEHKYLFHRGTDHRCYEIFGAHRLDDRDPDAGFVFRVWAPDAEAVSLVGVFNGWDIEKDPMKRLEDDESIWEVSSAAAREGDLYKFAIRTKDGRLLYKADPYAFESESARAEDGSQRASRIFDIAKGFKWHDEKWIEERNKKDPYRSPMNIYEVHLGSWMHRQDGSQMTYDELAEKLIAYVKDMGYTHIELMPVMEHPFDGSWGYQITGYYSVTSRYGDPDGFKRFVDKAHQSGIGVILDWVPAHFPKDDYGLVEFDGGPLYEYKDPLRMEHKGWGTRAFDLGRGEVKSFLISNAFFYCREFHADGLRVDAVAAMLYLNYDRQDGEWTPNDEGGTENKEAVSFLRDLNRDIQTHNRGVLMIAEESTAWPNVTKPPAVGGLGFNFKWNMGWMNDVLEYFQTDAYFRKGSHNKLTFAITYAYSENFILPISHDEVVHGKKSLLDKMPGEYDDKFAQLRCFLVYMMTHPGKKLTFMGQEIGQFIEWDEKRELDWMLLDYDRHREIQQFVRELNHYYLERKALWLRDTDMEGFTWIDADNALDNVYTYYRQTEENDVTLVCLNLSGRDFEEYEIGVPDAKNYRCVIDTDLASPRTGKIYRSKKGQRNGLERYIKVSMPKYSAMILEMGDAKCSVQKNV